ncbi:MAG: leucine-rich repeat protein [Acutalibacteraceae bacterium]|nr:leucine-rich repeat protein [Acutalibacteraceae bacterium]
MSEKGQLNIDIKLDEFGPVQTHFDPYTGNEPYLFVSYSHRDTKIVYPILDALSKRKYRIWYDESCETGNDFRDELRQRIEKCEAVLLFVSKASMNSPFCGMEVIVARENNKKLYPIYLDDAEVPPAFQILLANTHHGSADNKEKLIKSLLRDLPPEAMDRLTTDNDFLIKCEDNGKTIEVDEGIKEIGAEAFKTRRGLESIKLPSTLETIGLESFRGCTSLAEMEIPENTIRIGESAFRDCTNMKRLIIRNNCIKIGERAFENCAGLETVELPEGLTEIYGGVFNSCKSLKNITLPKNLTILGESAFSDCIILEEVDIPETVTKIDDLAFNGCIKMRKIEFHEGLKKIGKSAFKNCRALTDVSLPATVTSISNAPFRGCESLKSIKVASKNKFFKSEPNKREGSDHVLFNKNKSIIIAYPASSREVQYDIPDSVTIISDWAFCECKKLTRITIPDSVREIGEGAFCNCEQLDEVEIPDSVIVIDDCAFRGCTALERVVIPSSVTELGWGLFDGCENKVVVYCDEGSFVESYCKRNGIRTAPMCEKEND